MKSNDPKKQSAKTLNPKRELFCYLYARDSHCMGNAAQAYSEAYDLTQGQYESATRAGSRLLRFVEVRERIQELLDECFDQKTMDRELLKVALQDKDLSSKVAAIKEYNRIYGREAVPEKTIVEFSWLDPEPRPNGRERKAR